MIFENRQDQDLYPVIKKTPKRHRFPVSIVSHAVWRYRRFNDNCNKKAATRFLSCLLGSHPAPRVIITDKLKSYIKPIRYMMPGSEH